MSRETIIQKLMQEPDICVGGSLLAIVYCCASGECPYRDVALNKLGLPKNKYFQIKNRYTIRHNRLCFRNLAYCCSLLKPCEKRDLALRELNITDEDYLNYKASILEKILEETGRTVQELENIRIVKPFTGLVQTDEGEMYVVQGLISPEAETIQVSAYRKHEDGHVVITSRVIPIYLPIDIYEKLMQAKLTRLNDFIVEAIKKALEK